ncbi:MAG: ATP-dependent sacrificial sulfur transferase LarE [Synergistaceae bacterium]|nr:ATP-dependent sacrificial sulfur transferase LarE [Synergistaceae bacterium]
MDKLKILQEYISSLGSAAVAFSGGVDSTFLLKVSHDVLGSRAIAVTASSLLFPHRELKASKSFCEAEGIKHIVLEVDELGIEGFRHNPKNRCYLCKKGLFTEIQEAARRNNIENVIEGSNLDDLSDYRPGLKAIEELGVISPLRHCGLTKNDVRQFSKELGLPTWDKPSFACLASRFVYGEEITVDKLKMVERSEELLRSMGFRQFRVRVHGDIARIEVLPEDFPRILDEETRLKIYDALRSFGFSYAALDLKGYRTGSMNEGL